MRTALLLLFVSGCVTTPLSRSYDDPYNAPLPNEEAPPSIRPDEEACLREGMCEELCTEDRDCNDGQICYKSKCVDPDPL